MNKPKVLLLFPNTSNEGVAPLAISILSTIAKQSGFEVKYFETSFYQKSKNGVRSTHLTKNRFYYKMVMVIIIYLQSDYGTPIENRVCWRILSYYGKG